MNLVLREYNRDETDLAVKVPGGRIAVTRRYENNRWQWGEERERLTLKRETIYRDGVAKPGSVLQIEKAGVLYNPESSLQPIFLNDTYRIKALGPDLSPTGYRFEVKSGSRSARRWKPFSDGLSGKPFRGG